MTIVEVVNILYPNEFALGNVAFEYDNDNNIIISKWTVSGVEKPSEAYLASLIPQYEAEYQAEQIKNQYSIAMQAKVDEVAQSKGYKDGFACAGYFNSTNAAWKAESEAFVAWRDAIWEYAHQVLDNSTPENYPTLEQFLANAPTIVWP